MGKILADSGLDITIKNVESGYVRPLRIVRGVLLAGAGLAIARNLGIVNFEPNFHTITLFVDQLQTVFYIGTALVIIEGVIRGRNIINQGIALLGKENPQK